jgi:hypothetical protein
MIAKMLRLTETRGSRPWPASFQAARNDLGRLLDVERLPGFVVLQGRALQVHPELCRPNRRGIGAGAPPDARAQPLRIRLQAQQARRVLEHRPGVWLGKTVATQHVEEHLGMAPAHIGIALALGRAIAEIAPAIDHLLGRAPAEPQLEAPAGDQVSRARILGHVERVLVPHVDDPGANLDAAGLGAHGGQQRERRGELAGEMMNAEIGAVRAQFLGCDGQVDRLQQRVCGGPRLRLR